MYNNEQIFLTKGNGSMAKKVEKKAEQPERRKSVRSDETKKNIINRVSRLEGQLKGIKNMVEDDRYCDDILIQLSAIDMSIKGLANLILENHIYTNVIKELKNDNISIVSEMIELFKRFQ